MDAPIVGDGGSGGRHGGKGDKGGTSGVDSGGSSAGGSDSGGSTSAGGQSASGGTGGTPSGTTPLGKYVLTWYSYQDNTPVNSLISASGHLLVPFVSVALPFTQIKDCAGVKPKKGMKCTGTINYGDKLYVDFLKGRKMPNGTLHTGWVMVDDYCGDNSDDTYCYQKADDGMTYPNVDLYLGDFSKSGMAPSGDECTGPAGNGGELFNLSIGDPGSQFITNYGGAQIGTGKCGDRQAARNQQFGPAAGSPFGDENSDGSLTPCWGYDGQGDGQANGDCADCMPGVTCAP